MRSLILAALLAATAAPVLAQVPPPDIREDRRDVHRDDRDLRHDERRDFQDRRDLRQNERRDLRQDERRDFRQDDRRDFRDDRRDGRDFRDGRRDFREAYRDDRRGYGPGDGYARFRGPAFYYPRGYGYRYYGVGTILPRVFFDRRYFIVDPYAYRLPPAFGGTRWVRVGPDALLIRVYDGRIVRVIQGLFY